MFDEISERLPFRLGVFLLHQLGAVLIGFVSSFAVTRISTGPVAELIGWSLTFVWAYYLATMWPVIANEGKWVWIAGITVFVLGVAIDAQMHSYSRVMSDYLIISNDRESRDGHTLLTYPMWATVCYAIGITFGTRTRAAT